ncbi:MAG: hypothetical protein U0Q19_11420 [Kineosporiaceae bacterium]
MAGRHPAHDTLADLAAEVLPEHDARLVEAHVIGCTRCAQLLADAEGMRQLLRSTDPGPMPEEVWQRIASALSREVALGSAPAPSPQPVGPVVPTTGGDPWITQEWPVDAGWVPQPGGHQVASDDAPTSQWARFVEADDEPAGDGFPDGVRLAGSAAASESLSRLRPARRSSSLRTRRDVRTEGEGRGGALMRFAKPAAIAAGVIVLAGVGGLAVVKQLPMGGSSAASGGAAPAAEGKDAGAYVAAILQTGTNYTPTDMGPRALALAETARRPVGGASASAAQAAAAGAATSTPTERRVAAGQSLPVDTTSDLASSAPGLTDPGRLEECLEELNAGGHQPIAIDLARYDGREAAIIVLTGRDGGYEVWAVSRSCGRGNAGQLGYVSVPAR